MHREICGRCHARQPNHEKKCFLCGSPTKLYRLCAWCTNWVPNAERCQGCDAPLFDDKTYPLAKFLVVAGVDKLELANRARDLDTDKVRLFTQRFEQQKERIKRFASEILYCEPFLVGKGYSTTFYDEQCALLPMDEGRFRAPLASELVLLKGKSEDVLFELTQRAQLEETKMLAEICLLRLRHPTKELPRAVGQLLLTTTYGNEAVAACGHWAFPRAQNAYYYAADEVPKLAKLLLKNPVFGEWAAVTALGRLGHDEKPHAETVKIAKGALKRNDDLGFSAALVLNDAVSLRKFAKDKLVPERRELARKQLVQMGDASAVEHLSELKGTERSYMIRRVPHPPPKAMLTLFLKWMEKRDEETFPQILQHLHYQAFASYEKDLRKQIAAWFKKHGTRVLEPRELLEFFNWSTGDGESKKGMLPESKPIVDTLTAWLLTLSPPKAKEWLGWTLFERWIACANDVKGFQALQRLAYDRETSAEFIRTIASRAELEMTYEERDSHYKKLVRLWDTAPAPKKDILADSFEFAFGYGNTKVNRMLMEHFWSRWKTNRGDRERLTKPLAKFPYELPSVIQRDFKKVGDQLRIRGEIFKDVTRVLDELFPKAVPSELPDLVKNAFALMEKKPANESLSIFRKLVSSSEHRRESDPHSEGFRLAVRMMQKRWKTQKAKIERTRETGGYDFREYQYVDAKLAQELPKPLSKASQRVEKMQAELEAFKRTQTPIAQQVYQVEVQRLAGKLQELAMRMSTKYQADQKYPYQAKYAKAMEAYTQALKKMELAYTGYFSAVNTAKKTADAKKMLGNMKKVLAEQVKKFTFRT